MRSKTAQVGIEYLIILGLVTFIVTITLGMAFYYSNNSRDVMRISQMQSFSNKVISSAETVFYYGAPAKATINVYLPEGISSIDILENSLVITIQTSTGINKNSFLSNVPISGQISAASGLKKIKLEALSSGVLISKAD